MQWLVTLGDFQSSDGLLAKVGWTGKRLQVQWSRRYHIPPERQLHGKGFTGAEVLANGSVLVCGFNAIYWINPDEDRFFPWLVRDDFNDLHDVALTQVEGEQRIIVANTGFDCIDVFSSDGVERLKRIKLKPLNTKAAQIQTPDPYFDELSAVDRPLHLRKLRDRVHANAVVAINDQIWVSRLVDKAISLAAGKDSVISLSGCPHDLVPWQDRIWFTTTDGYVWSVEESMQHSTLKCELDSYSLSGRSGWVRGLSVTESFLLVGCTRISGMPRERWINRPFDQTETGLLLVNRFDCSVLDWVSLNELAQNPKVFGIYPWRPV